MTDPAPVYIGTEVVKSPITLDHPLYLLVFVPFFLFFLWYLTRDGLTRKKIMFLAVRSVIIVLVAVAIASPVYFESRKRVMDVPPVTVLVDSSPSMDMYPQTANLGYFLAEAVKGAVGNLSGKSQTVKIEFFSDGNRTAVGDALYHTMVQYGGEPMSVVLVSDGRSNSGRNPVDMAKILFETNSTVYTMEPQKQVNDLYIQSVLGEKKIPSNTQYDLLVRVGNTGYREASYDLNVYIDNIRKFNKRLTQNELVKDVPLTFAMKDIGVHEVKVELGYPDDGFQENNVFYKTVEVVEKPKILYVTSNSSSPMLQVLNRLYSVDVSNRAGNEYARYAGVIFDNMNAQELDRNVVNRLKKYILEGNGVAFVGGRNSFEYGGYNNSFVENILPVKSTEKPTERRRQLAVVFLVDISESTEYGVGKDSKIDVEKAVAIGMIRALNTNDSVGIIAFNTMPYTVTPISPIGPKASDVEDRVMRLQFGGGTDMQYAIETAAAMLDGYTVDRYVVLISDGVIRNTRWQLALNKIAQMKDSGIRTFTVGVGFDTDETFMQQLAQSGGGQYFSLKSNPENRLKIVFGEQEDDKTKATTPVIKSDEYHFITRNLVALENVGASVSGYNKVYEKNIAQVLLSTKGGKPVLTVWRFGLGRVAALTTDNGIEWSQELIKVDSGRVVSAMTNWIIGDLEKGKKVRINSQDASLGDPIRVTVTSQSAPTLEAKNTQTLEAPQVLLTRTGISSYTGSFLPKDGGFIGLRAQAGKDEDLDAVAVNYPPEYASLGVDEDLLRRIASSAGARLYSYEEKDALVADIMGKVKEASIKEERNRKDLWPYFAGAALALYFIDTVIRRLAALFKKEEKSEERRSSLGR